MKELKHLNCAFNIKAADEEDGVINGYASTFGNKDLGFDIVERGAFAKTLRENRGRFPILSHHNPTKQIGWNVEAEEDDHGLKVQGRLDLKNNATAREQFSLAKQAMDLGVSYGLSIGFIVDKEDIDHTTMTRTIKEVKLFEYSLVTFPMNEEATVTSAKSYPFPWMGQDQDQFEDIHVATKNFLQKLSNHGYDDQDIISALNRAAEAYEKGDDPDDLVQSIEHLTRQFKQKL